MARAENKTDASGTAYLIATLAKALREQLLYLVECGQRRNVTTQVMPLARGLPGNTPVSTERSPSWRPRTTSTSSTCSPRTKAC